MRLDAFETLVGRLGGDPAARERAQLALAPLGHKAGYDLWSLAQPGAIAIEGWFVLFPMASAWMLATLGLWIVWPPALLLVALGAAVSIGTQLFVSSAMTLVFGPFRQLGPLVAAADALRFLDTEGAGPITGSLAADVAALARVRRIAAWVTRDAAASFDPFSVLYEYLNMLFLFDANALYFGGRELRARSGELLRVIAAVGEVDAALAVASFRAGTSNWTRPVFSKAGGPARLTAVRHPLIADAVPNSIALAPPHGVIVTGSNMSGKTTFLRTVGVAAVMAQSINTCLADVYAAPVFFVRSCIGRADDLAAGKSYYIVEVECVLDLVRAAGGQTAQLLLFDELFRGTNAVERIAAGEAVLAELVLAPDGRATPHVVLAATHDHELVDLLRDRYAPYHFTDTVGPEGLTFTYRLEPGPATTRNAIALLQAHGAPARLVDRALARAEALDRDRGPSDGNRPSAPRAAPGTIV